MPSTAPLVPAHRRDGRDPGGVTAVQGRTGSATRWPADIPYLSQVARAAEQAGFLVAFRAGFASPTLLAQQADAFRRFAGGRLALNVVTGGDPVEQRAYGDRLEHDARYARTEEVMKVLRTLLDGKTVDHHGAHLRIEGARLAEYHALGTAPDAGDGRPGRHPLPGHRDRSGPHLQALTGPARTPTRPAAGGCPGRTRRPAGPGG
ncbi:LLM class flavin-dependent oxidoreductase [Streptomyces sp. NPDC002467]|uniref:LLM class flavin-dependent oxidoreductase n=1 Tax=Streptomyces sp. NPDC002467 TaxID=3364647 RepID=UPI0036BDE816